MNPSPDSTAPEAEATEGFPEHSHRRNTDSDSHVFKLMDNVLVEFYDNGATVVILRRGEKEIIISNDELINELAATRQESGEDKALAKKTAGITCYHSPEMVIGTENGYVCAECWALEGDKDSKRLDWLEEQTRLSRTGVSFDYCRCVEDGHVVEKGFRYMRHHHLGERNDSIRAAIDKAMEESK